MCAAFVVRYVCGLSFSYVFNMTKTFFMPTSLHKQNSRKKKVSRQRKPQIFLEGKSDIAINIDSERKIRGGGELMWSIYHNTFLYSKAGGGQKRTHVEAPIFCV